MAKLTAFAALFLALIAFTTAYTTVVTTTVINDDENPQFSCQTEVQKMQMSHCKQWMERGIGPYETNPEDHQSACCREMRKVRPDCRCEMMRKMKTMKPTMEMGKMHTMFSKCGIQMPMECSM